LPFLFDSVPGTICLVRRHGRVAARSDAGHEGYSTAEHLAAAGNIVPLIDHL